MKIKIENQNAVRKLTMEEIETEIATKGYDGFINSIDDVYILRNGHAVCLTKDNCFDKPDNTFFTVKAFCYLEMKAIIL